MELLITAVLQALTGEKIDILTIKPARLLVNWRFNSRFEYIQ